MCWRPRSSGFPTRGWRNDPWPSSSSTKARQPAPAIYECSSRTRSFVGGCPKGGPSRTRFPAPAWANTTRRPSDPATRRMPTRSSRRATEGCRRPEQTQNRADLFRKVSVFMGLRVIQWATGSVGVAAIKGVLDHPELELVGCWVHSESKAGKDVGEIIGTSPLGGTATNNIDDRLV